MKFKHIILSSLCILFLFVSCSKEEDENINPNNTNETGLLSVKMTTWNSYENNSKGASIKGDTITLDIIDSKKFKFDLRVTTDEIKAGVPDNFKWITIYESDETLYDSERDFEFELPAGNYKGIAIVQGNQHHWVCKDGGDIMELPDLNDRFLPADAHIYNIFGEDGLYVLDENSLLTKVTNDEKLGTFEVLPNRKTIVTIRMNLLTLDWIDNDGDGQWSEGDELDNWTTPEGIDTMADFIVEYE
jgi:hypothetical protein